MKYWWWPPARKKAKIAAIIMGKIYQDHEDEIKLAVRNQLLYGIGEYPTPPNPFGISKVRLATSVQDEINNTIEKG